MPLQNNLDYGGGAQRSGSQYIINIQPVIPIKLTDDWNHITRTIVPLTDVVHIVPGNPVGMGDIPQSFFFSPAKPVNGIILGAGPVFLYPTATRDEISANQFAAGPTFVALMQSRGYTFNYAITVTVAYLSYSFKFHTSPVLWSRPVRVKL